MNHSDCVVIGGGAIGLAVAVKLSAAGRQTVLVERDAQLGTRLSARSSEVVHAGLYYPAGSMKAKTCVQGQHQLYDWCEAYNIAHQRIGKMVLAQTEQDLQQLEALQQRAQANGVEGLQWLDYADVARMEPLVFARAALYSPSTGIFDSHAYIQSLLAVALEQDVTIAQRTQLLDAQPLANGWQLLLDSGGKPMRFHARQVIICGGLESDLIARLFGMKVPEHVFCKGAYWRYRRRLKISHLLYPLPPADHGGLGVHTTLTLDGGLRFGPDSQWVEGRDTDLHVMHNLKDQQQFAAAVQRYLPDIRTDWLVPDYASVRPKLAGPGEESDFEIHQADNVITLLGIESPGLTASLALADEVVALLD